MITRTLVKRGLTVPSTYSWDSGPPLSGTNQTPAITAIVEYLSGVNQFLSGSTYIQGYAPTLSVEFINASISDLNFEYTEFNWDFGDFYNTINNNISLSCIKNTSHVYIMPGIYTAKLKQIQTKNASSLYGTINSNLSCFGKYCSFWNWYDLSTNGNNPITWEQTKINNIYTKKWVPVEANNSLCINKQQILSSLNIIAVQEQISPSITIEVLEIPPKANMYSTTSVTTGVTPLSVQLSPRKITAGSFPIDRIDWDFGDDTPIKTVTRYGIPDLTFFTFTCALPLDINDPRNYDAIYTYRRTFASSPIFYPSLTAYSSSTGTFDTCSLTIGPISLTSISDNIHLLKVRNTQYGKLYGMQVNDYTAFLVASETTDTVSPPVQNIPQNTIKDSFYINTNNKGYTGINFPSLTSVATCP
jgi:PKD repeat protein